MGALLYYETYYMVNWGTTHDVHSGSAGVGIGTLETHLTYFMTLQQQLKHHDMTHSLWKKDSSTQNS